MEAWVPGGTEAWRPGCLEAWRSCAGRLEGPLLLLRLERGGSCCELQAGRFEIPLAGDSRQGEEIS